MAASLVVQLIVACEELILVAVIFDISGAVVSEGAGLVESFALLHPPTELMQNNSTK